jgi:hypothetical protein
MTPEERAEVDEHLYFRPVTRGHQRKSSLMGNLRDARGVAGRDLDTGCLPAGARNAGGWMAAIGYLILLDQIGTCFAHSGLRRSPREQSFSFALRCFTGLQPEQIDALYAARCALAHDYSLVNPSPNPALRHIFNYTESRTEPLVKPPTRPWDGDYASTTDWSEVTVVNLWAVGDVVEEVVATLRDLHSKDDLELLLSLPEFRLRYRLFYRVGDPE